MAKVAVPFIRTPFNYDRDAASAESALLCLDESLTQQHMAEECDINTIVRRFGLTGEMPDAPRVPQYGDFTGVSDYQSALNAVIEADAAFMELPAEVRARFHHSPQNLLEFVSREENREEAVKLGLLKDGIVMPGMVPEGDDDGGAKGNDNAGAAGKGDKSK